MIKTMKDVSKEEMSGVGKITEASYRRGYHHCLSYINDVLSRQDGINRNLVVALQNYEEEVIKWREDRLNTLFNPPQNLQDFMETK